MFEESESIRGAYILIEEHADLDEVFDDESTGQQGEFSCSFVVQQEETPSAGFFGDKDIARSKVAVSNAGGVHSSDTLAQLAYQTTSRA
jgi:hypothetical protein